MLLIFVGMMMISLALSYAWWYKVRVIRLRQDLFDARDALFDSALEMGALDDPAYRAARRHLNAIVQLADAITLPVLAFVLHRGVSRNEMLNSNNVCLQKEIDAALDRCADRLVTYLLRETFTGLIVVPILRLVRIRAVVESQARRWLRRILASDVPETFKHSLAS